MPAFGKRSLDILAELHPDMQRVLKLAIARTSQDFTLICGYRSPEDQNKAYAAGNSKAKAGQSPHNYKLSAAVDVIPYPFKGWKDKDIHKELRAIADVILACAKELGVSMRWGADWNMNGRTDDEKFVDGPHFEMHPWRQYVKG